MTTNDWYWIDGSCYCPACVECATPAADAADCTRGPGAGRCACCHGNAEDGAEYRVAFEKADGSWDIVETFDAESDADANAYAEQSYSGREWYVLDASGRNINGGRDQ